MGRGMTKFPLEGSGKGDSPRPVNKKQWDVNWLQVFGKVCQECEGFGYIVGEEFDGNQTSCLVCGGIGKVEK